MNTKKVPLCADCKHMTRQIIAGWSSTHISNCLRTLEPSSTNPVSGAVKEGDIESCESERGMYGSCGEVGINFARRSPAVSRRRAKIHYWLKRASLLVLLLAVTSCHALVTGPALWSQGSGKAFDMCVTTWVFLLVVFAVFAITVITEKKPK